MTLSDIKFSDLPVTPDTITLSDYFIGITSDDVVYRVPAGVLTNLHTDSWADLGYTASSNVFGRGILNISDTFNVPGTTSYISFQGYLSGTPGATNSNISQLFFNSNNDGFGDFVNVYYSRGTTQAPQNAQNLDFPGAITWFAYNGNPAAGYGGYAQVGIVEAYVSGSPSSSSMPGALLFATTKTGATVATTSMVVDHRGYMALGGAVPTGVAMLEIAKTDGVKTRGIDVLQAGTSDSVGATTQYYNSVYVYQDAINSSGAPSNGTGAFQMRLDVAGGVGQKFGGTSTLFLGANSATGGDLVGFEALGLSSFNNGGTNTGAGAVGTLFGLVSAGYLASGATNFGYVMAAELDVGVFTGASVKHRWGISVNGKGDVRGASTDAAIVVGANNLSFNTGLMFGALNGAFGVSTAGTLIGTDGSTATITNVIDVSTALTVSGSLLKGPNGFNIDGTGHMTLGAGTTTLAPLNFASGTNQTTAAVGAVEFDGKAFYATSVASSRQVVGTEQVQVLSGSRTFTNNTNAQAIFNASANGAVSLAAATTYEFEMMVVATGFSGSSHTLNLTFATSGSFTDIGYYFNAQTGSTLATPTAALSGFIAVGTASAICAATTATGLTLYVRGTMRMNAVGTVTPQLTQVSNSAAAVVQAESFFRCWPIGTNTVTNVGNWS